MAIDWSLLKIGDPGAAFQAGIARGQEQRRQGEIRGALSAYAAAPSQSALAPLATLDPETFSILSQNERQAAEARAREAERTREAEGRALGGTYLRQRAGAPAGTVTASLPAAASAPTLTAAAGAAPASTLTSEEGDIVVTGHIPQPTQGPTVGIADVFEKWPELADNLVKLTGSMDESGRKAFAGKYAAAAAVGIAAKDIKPEERRAYLDNHYPLLRAAGWTDRELDAFDPTDDNIDGIVAVGIGADKVLADQRAAAGQAITVRGQDVSAATARRGQDISAATTRRGQNIGAATARAGQAVTMRGQDMSAATALAGQNARTAPKPAQLQLARSKIASLDAIDKQLAKVEQRLNAATQTGPVFGRIGIGGKNNAADVAISQLAPLIRQLTRVPGEGAMSDYESRLANAGLPSRTQTKDGRDEAIAGLRDLVNAARAGYGDIAGSGGTDRRSQFKVVR